MTKDNRTLETFRTHPAIFDVATWFPILFAAVSFPMMSLSRTELGKIEGDVNFIFAAAVYLILGALGLFLSRHRKVYRNFFRQSDIFILAIICVVIFQILSKQSILILTQLCVFLIAFFSIRVAGFSSRFSNGLLISSLVLTAFVIFTYVALGPPEDRWLGGIHPNVFGSACVALIALSLFGPRYWIDIAFAISFAAALGVSSRYAMVTGVLIYSLFWALNWRHAGAVRMSVVVLGVLYLIANALFSTSGGIIGEILMLDNPGRGLSSGISGRDEHWIYFLPQFFDRPLLGYGFRNRSAYFGPHNGFLEIFLQIGVVGAIFFFAYWFLRLKDLIKEYLSIPRTELRGRLLVILLGLSFGAQLQPQFFSFGDPFGICAMICLFARNNIEKQRYGVT